MLRAVEFGAIDVELKTPLAVGRRDEAESSTRRSRERRQTIRSAMVRNGKPC